MSVASESTSDYFTAQSADTTLHPNSYDGNHSSTLSSPVFIPCDNPRNVVSPFVAGMTELVGFAGILPVFGTWGVIANVINMAVFARQGLSDRIHLCLFSLAVSDTGFLLSLMCGKSYSLISLINPAAGNYWHHHNRPVVGSYMGFLSISNFITALIAAERWLCVLNPLKAAKFFKTKYVRVVIIVVAVYTLVVMTTAMGLKFRASQVIDPVTNTSTFISELTPLYLRHRTIIDILYKQTLSVTLPVISLIVVIVCTITIAQRLKVTADWRRTTVSNMTSVEKQEIKVTRMLVTVCCVYVVCMIPNVSWSLMLLARLPGFLIAGHLCNAFRVTTALAHVLEVFNASVNFFIYIKQSSCYRSTLRQLCQCVNKQQKNKAYF
ncbi:hypothetical protein ACOMHN_050113 [Nucella lapillus]